MGLMSSRVLLKGRQEADKETGRQKGRRGRKEDAVTGLKMEKGFLKAGNGRAEILL